MQKTCKKNAQKMPNANPESLKNANKNASRILKQLFCTFQLLLAWEIHKGSIIPYITQPTKVFFIAQVYILRIPIYRPEPKSF